MVRPKKHLGQHFLRDENIAAKIAGYLTGDPPLVLEIGPGTGVLSRYILANKALNPWFMEIDSESVGYLNTHFPEMNGRIIHADFIDFDLSTFPPGVHDTSRPVPFALIGNFPYNISSQILFRVLTHHDRIPWVTGMFQKEVAVRIASAHGNRDYGILSVLLQAFYTIEYLFTVNESVFYPPPKVKSAVIRLLRNDRQTLPCEESFFIRVVKTAFNQRRKTLRNALRPLMEPMSEKGIPALTDPAILNHRAEHLSPSDFIALAAELSNFAQTSEKG